MNYPLWFSGTVVLLVAAGWGILTHFGLIGGALDLAPWLWAGAFTIYAVAVGLRWPAAILAFAAVMATLMIAIKTFNWLGLGPYI